MALLRSQLEDAEQQIQKLSMNLPEQTFRLMIYLNPCIICWPYDESLLGVRDRLCSYGKCCIWRNKSLFRSHVFERSIGVFCTKPIPHERHLEGVHPVHDEAYENAISIGALEPDLKTLPVGDLCEIGVIIGGRSDVKVGMIALVLDYTVSPHHEGILRQYQLGATISTKAMVDLGRLCGKSYGGHSAPSTADGNITTVLAQLLLDVRAAQKRQQ